MPSLIWLRSAGGWSPGDRLDPFANFFLGGFGNNWLDHGEIKRYRRATSFPGTELDAIAGTNYVKALADLNLRRHFTGLDTTGGGWFHDTKFPTQQRCGTLGIQIEKDSEKHRPPSSSRLQHEHHFASL